MRLDSYLSEFKGISRSRAKSLIEGGSVSVDGVAVTKPSFSIDAEETHDISVNESTLPYVSRGGLKLKGALDAFGVDPMGLVCADIGASTGGFTDCLLQCGAIKVYAIDSGTDQLAAVLKDDARVVSIEQFNARYLTCDTFGEPCGLAVADLSFISQTYVLGGIYDILSENGLYIGLIKPQFECGREAVGKGGIVKKSSDHLNAINKVIDFAVECGFDIINVIRSPIKGGDGNTEFLFLAKKRLQGLGTFLFDRTSLRSLVNQK